MSTKPTTKPTARPNAKATAKPAARPAAKPSTKPTAKETAKQKAAARRARRGFVRSLYGTIAILAILAGALTAGNLAELQHPNSVSALDRASGTASFEIYTLERNAGFDGAGKKIPDAIRGANLSGGGKTTVLASAPRIQEFAALPTALALATLNEDNTSALEIVPLDGGSPRIVPLPKAGKVENLRAAASGHLVGYTFTSSSSTDQPSKKLFVYDVEDPSASPKQVEGINGQISAADWKFVPGSTTLVVQNDGLSMFVLDPLSPGKVTPLGTHGGLLGFVPGTGDLVVADRALRQGIDPERYSTINLATGTVTQLSVAEGAGLKSSPDGVTATAGPPLLLNSGGLYAQVTSTFDAGNERSVVNVTDRNGPKMLYRPEPGRSRIANVCLSPTGEHLAIETAAPGYVGDQYPNRPAPTAMETAVVDVKTGALVLTVPGFLPNWCE
ncbi:MAG: hypothetical protein NTU93_00990 [Arthrobacter sp.]|nr:hypothetical protein [Arthrobacter sp.]